MENHTIILTDGRRLSYTLYGPTHGRPVLYFHGTPSSRLEPLMCEIFGLNLHNLLHQYNFRFIATDRPGMGLSTVHKKGNFLSFANDTMQLLQQIGIERCGIMCWSGGGPYALAMGYQYPAIITGLYIIAGFTLPFQGPVLQQMHANKFYFKAAKYLPWLLRIVLHYVARKKVKRTIHQFWMGLPDADYVYLKNAKSLNNFKEVTIGEACRQSSKGAVYEAQSYFKDLGFSLSAIQQPVHYWWGTDDKAIIKAHPAAIEAQVTHSIMHYKKGEGHLSIYLHYLEEVLQTISGDIERNL